MNAFFRLIEIDWFDSQINSLVSMWWEVSLITLIKILQRRMKDLDLDFPTCLHINVFIILKLKVKVLMVIERVFELLLTKYIWILFLCVGSPWWMVKHTMGKSWCHSIIKWYRWLHETNKETSAWCKSLTSLSYIRREVKRIQGFYSIVFWS